MEVLEYYIHAISAGHIWRSHKPTSNLFHRSVSSVITHCRLLHRRICRYISQADGQGRCSRISPAPSVISCGNFLQAPANRTNKVSKYNNMNNRESPNDLRKLRGVFEMRTWTLLTNYAISNVWGAFLDVLCCWVRKYAILLLSFGWAKLKRYYARRETEQTIFTAGCTFIAGGMLIVQWFMLLPFMRKQSY